jgi:hypothetical protein
MQPLQNPPLCSSTPPEVLFSVTRTSENFKDQLDKRDARLKTKSKEKEGRLSILYKISLVRDTTIWNRTIYVYIAYIVLICLLFTN